MKKYTSIIYMVILLILFGSRASKATRVSETIKSDSTKVSVQFRKRAFNFFIISDWGWNGYKAQKEVADGMAAFADKNKPQFIISCGDNFQIQGVASVQDPLWLTSFEYIYREPSLQVNWYPVLGNHDYKGNTQAEIDYSNISRRWRMESHYYTFVRKINDSISARFIFLDTPPLIEEYYKKPGYPDVFKQDSAKQIQWLNDVLANSREQWKLVFGHHTVYSASHTHGNTPDMIRKVKPLLEKYNAQFYFCGHDHDFQYLKEKNGMVSYIVTGTGGEPRPASTDELSVISKSVPGFSLVSLYADSIQVNFVDSKGNVVDFMKRTYKKQ